MAGTWIRLAHVELSSSGDVIDSGTFTAKDNLRVIVSGIGTGGTVNCNFTFNSDTGNNYAIRESVNGGSDSTNHTQANTDNLTGTVTGNVYAVVNITNISNKEKPFISEGMEVASGASNAPERKELVGKWTNTSSSITQIKANNGGSGSYDTGSYITVFGAADDTATDTTDNNSIFEENDTGKHYIWNATSDSWTEIP